MQRFLPSRIVGILTFLFSMVFIQSTLLAKSLSESNLALTVSGKIQKNPSDPLLLWKMTRTQELTFHRINFQNGKHGWQSQAIRIPIRISANYLSGSIKLYQPTKCQIGQETEPISAIDFVFNDNKIAGDSLVSMIGSGLDSLAIRLKADTLFQGEEHTLKCLPAKIEFSY